MNDTRRPCWWMLEVLLVILGVLLLGEGRIPMALVWHKVVSLIIMGMVFGLTALWVHVNRAALIVWEQRDDEDDFPLRRTYLRNEPSEEQVGATRSAVTSTAGRT